MTETKFLWLFTSRILYLTKTNIPNLVLLLCFFLFLLVTDKHETCSCWIQIIILDVDNFFSHSKHELFSLIKVSELKTSYQGKPSDVHAKNWLGQRIWMQTLEIELLELIYENYV